MKRLSLLIVIFLMGGQLFSQDNPFEKERAKMLEEFGAFKDSVNNEYEDFKKVIWREYRAAKTGGILTVPKPETRPVIDIKKPIPDAKPLLDRMPLSVVAPELALPKDDFLEKRSPDFGRKLLEIKGKYSERTKIDFYGVSYNLYYDKIPINTSIISKESITEVVKSFSENADLIQDMIFQWVNYASIMDLNDYGFLQLVRKTGQRIYNDRQKATLLTWYVLNKVGYDCRVGYTKESRRLYLLAPSDVRLLNTYTIMSGDIKFYYVINFDNDDLVTMKEGIISYGENSFKSDKKIDFLFSKPPNINKKLASKSRRHKTAGIDINLSYNVSYIDLLKELPTLDYPAYFSIPVSPETDAKLEERLLPLLKGKTTEQKVDFLLKFVWSGFDYKYDKDNFGRLERPQSAEEMLYYDYSDCEDHSALFAFLVKRFTDCEVLGVLYKNHASTAVKFKTRPNGYYLPAPYEDYLICDPTCIGASIGQCGANFIGVTPERVFKVQNFNKSN